MIKFGHDGTKLALLSLNVPPSEKNKSRGTARSGGEAGIPELFLWQAGEQVRVSHAASQPHLTTRAAAFQRHTVTLTQRGLGSVLLGSAKYADSERVREALPLLFPLVN